MRFFLVGLALVGAGVWGRTAIAGSGPIAGGASINRCLTSEQPAIVRDGMVPFGDGELFVWNAEGQAQIRRKGGAWTPVLQVADGIVYRVAGDPAGVLLARHRPGNEVVWIGADGTPRDRWAMAPDAQVSLFSQSGRRWAVTDKVLLPLLPQSKLGPPQALPAAFTSLTPPVPAPDVLSLEGGALLCLEKSFLDLTGYGPGLCERTGAAAWRITHPYRRPNLLCGRWIVQADERGVAVRSAETGKLETERRFAVQPQVACVGDDKVAVGERTLWLVSLPALAPVSKPAAGKGRVLEVAFVNGEIAFSREKQKGISFVPVSCALSGGRPDR
jgi:hypothetical protein